jgi:nucleotide-binding universal stress UspA family protein
MGGSVLIGYDGSPDAEAALTWGLEFAERERAEVHLLRAFDPKPHELRMVGGPGADDANQLFSRAETELATALECSRRDHPHVRVSATVERTAPDRMLIDRSRTAAAIVIGSRGQSRLSTLVAGSTAVSVASRAHCTVVAVRGPAPPGHGVVVGADGSPAAEAAIGFAFEQADALSAPLTVLHAWSYPPSVSPLGYVRSKADDPVDYRRQQRSLLTKSIGGWRDKFPDVDVQTSVVSGGAVTTLVAASIGSQLLVVGCHGGHILQGLVLGTVSQALLHRVEVPLAVVHLHD